MLKSEQLFKIDSVSQFRLIYGQNDPDNSLIDLIINCLKKAIDFFGHKNVVTFEIELAYSRSELDKIIGHKTDDWLCAYSFGDRFVIFHPDYLEKCSTHRKEEFGSVITHEASHTLTKQMNNDFSTWLNEGIAQHVAGQTHNKKITTESKDYFIKNSLFKNSDYNKFVEFQGYEISYKLVDGLLQKYGKDKIIELLNVKFDYQKSAGKNISKVLCLNDSDFTILVTEYLN